MEGLAWCGLALMIETWKMIGKAWIQYKGNIGFHSAANPHRDCCLFLSTVCFWKYAARPHRAKSCMEITGKTWWNCSRYLKVDMLPVFQKELRNGILIISKRASSSIFWCHSLQTAQTSAVWMRKHPFYPWRRYAPYRHDRASPEAWHCGLLTARPGLSETAKRWREIWLRSPRYRKNQKQQGKALYWANFIARDVLHVCLNRSLVRRKIYFRRTPFQNMKGRPLNVTPHNVRLCEAHSQSTCATVTLTVTVTVTFVLFSLHMCVCPNEW